MNTEKITRELKNALTIQAVEKLKQNVSKKAENDRNRFIDSKEFKSLNLLCKQISIKEQELKKLENNLRDEIDIHETKFSMNMYREDDKIEVERKSCSLDPMATKRISASIIYGADVLKLAPDKLVDYALGIENNRNNTECD